MTANVRSLVTRGKLTKQKADGALSLLKGVLDYTEFKDVDMVIEVCCVNSFLFNLENSCCGLRILEFGSFEVLKVFLLHTSSLSSLLLSHGTE